MNEDKDALIYLADVRIDELEDENAKLRELVQLMIKRQGQVSQCKDIPCGECSVKDVCDQEDELMSELGVEVDE